ncbi:hypothetical protein [Streptomyces olivoreticuli]|nr:hypothetical protein [Streptomyces olivoreticuli]
MRFTSNSWCLVRECEGRNAKPSPCVLDSQIIKISANVPLSGP